MKLRLKEMLEARGTSQHQLAKALGISQPSVNAWLVGRVRGGKPVRVFPDAESLEALCLFLECTPNDLLQLERESLGTTWKDLKPPKRGRPPKARDEMIEPR